MVKLKVCRADELEEASSGAREALDTFGSVAGAGELRSGVGESDGAGTSASRPASARNFDCVSFAGVSLQSVCAHETFAGRAREEGREFLDSGSAFVRGREPSWPAVEAVLSGLCGGMDCSVLPRITIYPCRAESLRAFQAAFCPLWLVNRLYRKAGMASYVPRTRWGGIADSRFDGADFFRIVQGDVFWFADPDGGRFISKIGRAHV